MTVFWPWYAASVTATPPTPPTPVVVDQVSMYFSMSARAAIWQAIPADAQEVSVSEAQRWLGTLCIDTEKETCCGSSFDERWIMAVSELALALYQTPGAIITGSAATSSEVRRQKLGDLEIEFFPTSPQTVRYGPKYNKVLQAYPWVGDIIGPWLVCQPSSVINRYRS